MDLAQKAFCGYMLLCGSIFVFAPQMPTADTFGSLEKSPEAFGVSCIYAQVVGCLMFMMLFQQCPGPRGLLLAIGALGAMMAKHIFVDGLVPPPPAMLFAGVTFCAAAVSGMEDMGEHKNRVGTYVFAGWQLIQMALFATQPEQMLKDSYPDISGEALTIGLVWCEVIAMESLMNALLQCPGALGRAMAFTANVAMMAKHIIVDSLYPPPPVMLLGGVVFVLSWHAQLTAAPVKEAKA